MAFVVTAKDQGSAATLIRTLLPVVTAAASVAVWLWARRLPPESSRLPLERAADELAVQVHQQWERAATDRGLMHPAPIYLRWRWSQRQVTSSVAAAMGRTGNVRFSALPGVVPITVEKLQAGGLEHLFSVYGGLDSGRLIILGGPGSGKSGAAILLLLDALKHRASMGTTDGQTRIPVPVLFTFHGWNPITEPFADWLAARLTRDYELLRAREYGPDVAARLIAGGHIAVILDGLDEMPEELRPMALRALNEQATFRLVVLTRSDELVTAVGDAHLRGAAALELCPIEPRQAAEYLASCQVEPLPPSWQHVTDALCHQPDGALAHALDNPLMLTLVRDTYRSDDSVDELTNGNRFSSVEEIENHLLDRVLPSAYAPHPGQPTPPYTHNQAQQWLERLALHMSNERSRDLAWWQIPRWAPSWPRVLVTALVSGFAAGFVFWLGKGLMFGFGNGLTVGLIAGFLYAFVFGFVFALSGRHPRRLGWSPSSGQGIRTNLIFALLAGLSFGLANGFLQGPRCGIVDGLLNTLVIGLVYGLVSRIGAPSTEATGPMDSESSWRRERQLGLKFGLVFGLVYGPALGLSNGLRLGPAYGITNGIENGLAFGFGVVLVSSLTWVATLAAVQLWWRQEAPVRLLRFLEDARTRQVLRSVGPVYQFRHSRLQDRLTGRCGVARNSRMPALFTSVSKSSTGRADLPHLRSTQT
jgi:hypothetical protein